MSKEYTENLLIEFGPDGNKLIPVVTQDFHTREVLILAFANKEAFEETRKPKSRDSGTNEEMYPMQ